MTIAQVPDARDSGSGDIEGDGKEKFSLTKQLSSLLENLTKSPPPDEFDTYVVVSERAASLSMPIPDDDAVHTAISSKLGTSVNVHDVDDFLRKVWNQE